jgi:hypothetical protein
VSPGKAAAATVWKNKGFWLLQTLAWAVWTALALSWFWLPDSKVWGIALSAVQGLAVIAGAYWLAKKALAFYRLEYVPFDGKPGMPRLLVEAVLLIAAGIYLPYKLAGWHPVFPSFAMQTISLVVRFGIAFLIAVSAGLILASLVGIGSAASLARSSSTPPSPQTAPSS